MLKKELVQKVIEKALSMGADFAEVFVEDSYSSVISFSDSKTKDCMAGKTFGAGVRVFYGEKIIYAYTNDLSEKALLAAAEAVAAAGKGNEIVAPIDLTTKVFDDIHPIAVYPNSVSKEEKIEFLRKVDKAARKVSDKISQVSINISDRIQKVLIANSEGLWATDQRNYVRTAVNSIASSGNEKQTASESPGAFAGYEYIRSLNPEFLGTSTAEAAVKMLTADYAPSGNFPVIIDNGFGGVIFHEACGHSLETTSVAKDASVFAGKLGKQIANPVVTAIDDGTIANAWGSENIDDEGALTQKTILIENGILRSYIVDKMGGKKLGLSPTGSGRRQSFRFAPASRMRNTYIAPGKSKLEELISSVDNGIYARKMGGGSVSPGTGDFNFAVSEGYMIKNGKIAEPVRGATLIGNGADVLMKISMVADNLALAEGMCGSVSGSVPTTVGQPAIKVDDILVGGRKGE